jgi:tripartite-type tricarboxylate transporter receptor subunit TctC
MGNIADHAKAGTIRILAAAGSKRPALRPDLPTIAEAGVGGFSTGAWWGLFAPANLPREVTDKIRTDVAKILATPESRKIYETNTLEPVDMTAEQFARLIRDDLDKWGALVKSVGLTPQ